jgi:hypothetical protein
MKMPLDSSIQTIYSPYTGAAVLVLISLILTGCEPPSAAPGLRPGQAAPSRPASPMSAKVPVSQGFASQVASKPLGTNEKLNAPSLLNDEKSPEIKKRSALNALGPITRVEQAGNMVELASSIITAKANPFLDWLPRPLLPVEIQDFPDTAVREDVPLDPFAAVNLLGVIYTAKSKVALVSVDEKQTQFVKKGGFVSLETGSAEVLEVRPDGIDLRLLNDGSQKRTFTLPDIVGYRPTGSAADPASGNPSGVNAKNASSLSSEGSTEASTLPALGELKKRMEHGSHEDSKKSEQGVSVNLQELSKGKL